MLDYKGVTAVDNPSEQCTATIDLPKNFSYRP